ncbi:HTTM domain-containing protein [Chondromyces apiculatus]|uniref:Vitamin K-dependent gamma-carboxylase n=1 Tax=Chondromyces apiculatus DSM 436 TaxID=1192034 RepID=A0A017SYJ0_9BACT|nr:HTTM domain-containing protein [Chondromyces apiculatus]EYF01680.1 Vitamin K-dependent gamma-carboxylase [Chondromyces apiculatus DSM 436]
MTEEGGGTPSGPRRAWLDRAQAVLLAPKDAAGLAAFRFLFGLLGFVSALRFQVYGWVDDLFVTPRFTFHYFGAGWVAPLGPAATHALFLALTVLSACVALGLFYRPAVVLLCLGFTYVQLLDVTNYLNHYYLFSLLAALMALMPLNTAHALDARLFPRIRRQAFPAWCTYLLRFQVGVVYTFAGLAKVTEDWLVHAQPLQIWLAARTDLPLLGPLLTLPEAAHVMSWAGCLFDLSVAWFLLAPRTRPFAYVALLVFHALTKLLFPIGMFPAIMVVAAMVFFSPGWPRRFLPARWAARLFSPDTPLAASPPLAGAPSTATASASPWLGPILALTGVYMALQLFLPLRTHLYGGNVLWHEQGMRFSWRVMVREKNGSVTYRVTNPTTGRTTEVHPRKYLDQRQQREFSAQPDLILQLAQHIADDVGNRDGVRPIVQVDAIASLNGRRPARLINPDIDLARTPDSLARAAWIMPAPNEPPPVIRPVAWKSASYDASR